jgi:hypothetical protein
MDMTEKIRNRDKAMSRRGVGSETVTGAGQRSARLPMRLAVLGVALVLVLGLASGAASAAPGPVPLDGPGPVLGGGGTPLPPTPPLNACAQRCFDTYIQNIGLCVSLFCGQFLFITWCDDDEMTQCKINAQEVFELCLAGCNE